MPATTPPETPPPSVPPRVGRGRLVFTLIVTIVCGGLVALQSRVNGELGVNLGDGFVAALISFGSGLVIVVIALVISPRARHGLGTVVRSVRTRRIPWWHICGGVAGGLFVLSQGLTVGLIGVALFTVATVAGQSVGGLIIDARGIGTVAPKGISLNRLLGAAIALAAVLLAVIPQIHGQVAVWVIAMPLVVGLLLGWQQAVNGQVKTLANSAITATFFNFLAGTAVLLVFAIVHTAILGLPHGTSTNPFDYLGGVIGVVFIAGFAFATPIIGVLLQSLAAVAGQLIMALVLAIVAPTSAVGVAWTTIVGTVLTLVGVAVASVPSRRAR